MGNINKYFYKLVKEGDVEKFFAEYNKKNKQNIKSQRSFSLNLSPMDGIITLTIIIIFG